LLKTRLATAAVALPAIWLIARYLPAALFSGFILAVTAVGLYEYFTMAFPEQRLDRRYGVLWGIVVAGAVACGRPQAWGASFALGGVAGLALVMLRPDDLSGGVARLGLTLLGVLYAAFFTPHLILLREVDAGLGWRWVLFTVYVAMASDSGGYFSGRAFGRQPLAPAISPSKTVEGAAGAVAGAVLVACVCRIVFFPVLGWMETVFLAAVMSVLAQLGDLCESALKRAFGAKDSGWIIPGHGGILDRLDSILFPVVFAYYYATLS
jgi:phosphatidate cytidylyltransferase